jgi:glycerophosphoryl diester phosphodiesterase
MLTALLATLTLSPATGERPLPFVKPFLRPGHHFVVVAHRGSHLEAPENSLDAYEQAIKDGCDFGEADLRMTKDGVIVLMHDDTVDRTTNGHGKVRDLTFAQIRALHFKHPRRQDEKVPTFEELLGVCKGKLKIYMDIKAVKATEVLPLVIKHGMQKDVIAYLYGPLHRMEWAAAAPSIPVISDIDTVKSPDEAEEAWKGSKFQLTDGDCQGEFVTKWHSLGVALVMDVQSSNEGPAYWQPLIDRGLDGFQSDHPAQLIDYLKEKGIR